MRDTVRRFRKICENLINGKTKTRGEIQRIMNISDPTLKRLMTATLDEEFHIRASILGAVQDFNKKFCDYERIDIEPEANQDAWKEHLKKNKPENFTVQLSAGIQPGIREPVSVRDNLEILADILTCIQEQLDPDVTIRIRIQGAKKRMP